MRQHILHIAFGLAPTRVKIPERCHHRTSVFHNMGYKIRMMYVCSVSFLHPDTSLCTLGAEGYLLGQGGTDVYKGGLSHHIGDDLSGEP